MCVWPSQVRSNARLCYIEYEHLFPQKAQQLHGRFDLRTKESLQRAKFDLSMKHTEDSWDALFKDLDSNHDGTLTKSEVMKRLRTADEDVLDRFSTTLRIPKKLQSKDGSLEKFEKMFQVRTGSSFSRFLSQSLSLLLALSFGGRSSAWLNRTWTRTMIVESLSPNSATISLSLG